MLSFYAESDLVSETHCKSLSARKSVVNGQGEKSQEVRGDAINMMSGDPVGISQSYISFLLLELAGINSDLIITRFSMKAAGVTQSTLKSLV